MQLQKMLDESHGKLAKHHAGEETIEDEEREKMEKRIEIIERKLERMEDMDERVRAFVIYIVCVLLTTDMLDCCCKISCRVVGSLLSLLLFSQQEVDRLHRREERRWARRRSRAREL